MGFVKKITQTNLFKITSLNSLSVLLKIGIGFITSKLMAIFIGPTGMALVGNLRNFSSSLESISTLGFTNGIVKYVAENKENKIRLREIVSTVFISLLTITLVLSLVLYFFASFWNNQIFGNNFDYDIVFKAIALVLPWYAISIFLLSLINGLGKFKLVIWLNILGNAIGLLVSIYMILNFKTLGALLSIVISPALLFFATFYFINKDFNFFKIIRFRYFDVNVLKNLSSYSLMALVSSVLGPLVYLIIRKNVIETVGLEQAGFWETIVRISNYYMMFVTTILSVYFLPKLAVAKSNQETKKIFWSFYRNILPPFVIALIVIYYTRFFIVKLLFTDEFLPVTTLFFWQLIGDVLRAASWILGFQFFAKKITKTFIISEITSLLVLYFFSSYLVALLGIQGVVLAQALDNFIYLIILGIYFRKSLF
ncbi:O-antigen translocase [Flavobacterium sp. N502540]|uniref:O-antigen translocase n=1 Tax=Flavobacterium sp. N502540 TaxID=2986838 RepID=UPI002224BDDA|nr:O-antigen translocase [Flavobacterium sp. N502540]